MSTDHESSEKSTPQLQVQPNSPAEDDEPQEMESDDDSSEKLPLILNGTYFKIVSSVDDGKNISAKCLKCTPTSKIINGSSIATSNFVTHLKRKHKDDFALFEEKKKEIADRKRRKKAKIISLLSNQSPPSQKLITQYCTGKPTQDQVDGLIKNYIINGMKPLTTVEEESFRDLVCGLCPGSKVMSRKRLKKIIGDDDIKRKSGIIMALKTIEFLCLTTDAWSVKSRSFLGITCHWIDQHLNRQSTALACHRFKGSHTFDRIAALLIETFEAFEIRQEKILCIVTDNGSNFVKAFRVFGSTDNDDSDSDQDSFDDILESESNSDAATVQPCLEFHDLDSMLTEATNPASPITLPKHHRCVAHTLSLVATKDSENAVGADYKRTSRSAFGKCTALWNCNSRSKSAEVIQQKCGKLLVTPCKTRWNSMYDSIRRLLDPDVKPHLDSICQTLKLPKFSQKELDFLEEYKKVTEPICQGLDIMQGDTFIGALLPTLFTIRTRFSGFATDSTLCQTKPLVTAMLDGLNTRFKGFFDMIPDKKEFVMATVSHPFFKLKWVAPEKYELIKTMFIDGVINMTCSNETSTDTQSSVAPQKTFNDFFVFPEPTERVQMVTACSKNRCNLECLQYLEDPDTKLESLQRYPSVKNFFQKFNTPIPSSAPVERLFSFGGMIMAAKRRTMSDETFQQLLLGKCNKKIK